MRNKGSKILIYWYFGLLPETIIKFLQKVSGKRLEYQQK